MTKDLVARVVGAGSRQALGAVFARAHGFRLVPACSGALVRSWLGLEAQGGDLRRIGWGGVLGAPVGLLWRSLVTPWP